MIRVIFDQTLVMKNIFYSLGVVLLLTACAEEISKENTPITVLSGTIENRGDLTVTVYDSDNNAQKIEIASDGTFTDTIRIEKANYYRLVAGRQNHQLFLMPNSDLNVTLDLASQEETPIFSGTAAKDNEYLAKKNSDTYTSDFSTFFAGTEGQFKSRIDSILGARKTMLANSQASEKFIEIEQTALEIERKGYLKRYPQFHPYYTDDKTYEMSENFLAELEDYDYDNNDYATLYAPYRNLVNAQFNESYSKIDSTFSNFELMVETIGTRKSSRVKDELLGMAIFFFNANNSNVKASRDALLSLATADGIKEKINTKYEKIKNLTPGNASPTFDYENYKGGKTALADLKGKYVYIDVWATWCGPCIGEIPSLKKVEHDFEGKNVEFVSISIDTPDAYQKWRDMIADKELGGTQLMSDNNWKSEFIKGYAIDGIPRFILLDPEGNIVSSDAKRPSNPGLTEQLEELTSGAK